MVLLNVAATRGPMALWAGYRMQNFAPELTLREVVEMVLPADHSDIARVEGRTRMDDKTVTDVTGAPAGKRRALHPLHGCSFPQVHSAIRRPTSS